MPSFSIVMANYNNAAFVDEAIRSVREQTFADWELVVVDDASTDGSINIIEPHLTDARIKLYRQPSNGGYTRALIFGLTRITSGIVGLLDSDDALTPNAIERVHAAHVEHPEVGLVLSQVVYCAADLTPLETTVTRPEHHNVPLVWMTGPNAFRSFKIAAYGRTSGLNPKFQHAEDWDLVFKLEEVAGTLRIDEGLYRYRILGSSASHGSRSHPVGIRSSAHALYDAYRRRGRARSDIPRPLLLARLAAAVRQSIALAEPASALLFALRMLRIAPFDLSGWRALARAAPRWPPARPVREPASGRSRTNDRAVPGTVLRSFAVSSLQSNTGNIEPDRIVCIPRLHRKGHCLFGGQFLIGEEGTYRAVFELDVAPYAFSVDPVVILDIYENLATRRVLAEREIRAADLTQNPRTIHLDFVAQPGYRVEFRVFWREQSALEARGVVLWRLDDEAAPSLAPADRASPTLRPTGSDKVSAIIPCYNGAPWLSEAIASIQAQTQAVHEIIVVDDCSTDGSYEIARAHGVTVLRNARNSGEGVSRNVGLQHATGDLIAWLDADDLWLPHHVETLQGLFYTYPGASVACAAVQRFGLRGELIRGHVPLGPPSNVFWRAFDDWVHTTIGSMTRREALLGIEGFDETERYSVDFDLWLRLSRHHLFVCTHDVTSRWRWHDAQQSAQAGEQIAALYRFRRRYWEWETTTGDADFAAEIASRMTEVWRTDILAAREQGDASSVELLRNLASLLPKPPPELGLAPNGAASVQPGATIVGVGPATGSR
jgi:glycosyltransferase involved in cell wall biosynthesis